MKHFVNRTVLYLIGVIFIFGVALSSFAQREKQSFNGIEGAWILEEWHMKDQIERPPKVEGRFFLQDGAFVLILVNQATAEPSTYYGYGTYTSDPSTFSMGFDKAELFKETASGITVSRKLPWEGMKSFEISKKDHQLDMLSADGTEMIVEGNSLILKSKGKVTRTYQRAESN